MAAAKNSAMQVTFLDRVVMHFAPQAGARRLQARARTNVLMNYDAATRGRRANGWRAPASSADAAASGGDRARMRNLARDFVRNRPFATRGISVITGNVVGTGIMPSIEASSASRRKKVEIILRAHLMSTDIDAMGQHSLPGLQRVAMNAVVEDGEVLIRRRMRSGRFAKSLNLPFQVELLEADYLDTRVTRNGQNEVVDGIEFGPTGRIEAYHLYAQHPGSAHRILSLKSVRIPASEIIHIRRADRPGQVRGVSWFAPVMLTLGDLSDYQEAEILKQKIAALMAGFLESDAITDGPANPADEEADEEGLGEIGPGTITALPPGKTIRFTAPPAVQGYDGFMRQNLAAVAMGLGITYESLAGDLSKVNFSSGRMGRIEMDRNVETWQQLIMVDQMCAGLVRWIKEAWLLLPSLGKNDFNVNWTAPRRALIDPTKEIPAIIKKVDAGLSSLQREQRQLGLDPEVIAREREDDAARAASMPADDANTPPASK